MSEGTLASAVALPDQDLRRQSPGFSAKRRKSSATDHDSKRRRFSAQDDPSRHPQRQRPSSPALSPDRPDERKPSWQNGGRDDERKRGQRLFGALLGTLSQSSSSAAQKRRADIEKRQQDKLKSQADEYDELKKRRKAERDAIRKKEKPLYEREAMQTRHSNLLAMAHFLKTRAEPVLYYKPWQLRPSDEAVIREQTEDAEATVAREVAEFEARYPPEIFTPENAKSTAMEEKSIEHQDSSRGPEQQPPPPEPIPDAPASSGPDTDPKEPQEPAQEATETTGEEVQHEQRSTPARPDVTSRNGNDTAVHDQTDVHRGAYDDGGEIVEDKEDTVIY